MNNSIIHLGDLGKPANTLIEKISDAVGGLVRPWQEVRVARAEAKADFIRAQSKIEISEVEARALERMVREEGKKQENIEEITAKALPLLNAKAEPEHLDNDWISHFFDKGRIISDAEMQQLWASMLAGEANKPGSFSKRTVDLVSTFDKRDAELFTRFCSFVWTIGTPTPLIFDINTPLPEDGGINFDSLLHLANIGLVRVEILTGVQRSGLPEELVIAYYGKPVVLGNIQKGAFPLGNCLFAAAGSQLCSVAGSKPSQAFFDRIINRLISENRCPFEPVRPPGYVDWYSSDQP